MTIFIDTKKIEKAAWILGICWILGCAVLRLK